MTNPIEQPERNTFPAYFVVKENDEGKIRIFRICTELEQAQEWLIEKTDEDNDNPNNAKTSGDPSENQNENNDTINSNPKNGFENQLNQITSSLRSIYDLISLNSPIRAIFPNLFIDRNFEPFREDIHELENKGNVFLYGVSEDRISQLNSKTKRLKHIEDGISSIPANVLMGLVARFDANISGLVRHMLTNRTSQLALKDKSVPVRDILAASSFEDLISDLVDDEIHSIMRGSHEDQVKYIEDTFSIEIRSGFARWPQFVEVFERRNLVAHGEGYANSRYDRICNAAKVPAEDRLRIGEELVLQDTYLRNATDLLLEFGILLTWWLWLKHEPKTTQEAYNSINTVTYDLILEKRYRLSERILSSALSRKTPEAPEVARRMMAVNLANCYKKLGEDQKFENALSKFDWTASADEFKISVASLREDVEQVCTLIPRVTDDNVVGKVGLRDWPVFDWIRDRDEVKEKFKEVFGEPLEIASSSGHTSKKQGNGVSVSIENEQDH